MALTKRIHCLVDPEPAAFHSDGKAAYAVNLSFECVSTNPEADEAEAERAFAAFLEALPRAKFWRGTVDASSVVTVVDDIAGMVPAAPSEDPADLLAWLHERKGTSGVDFWTVAQPSVAVAEPVEATTAGATHLLRAAQAWNAPVGHGFGLTRLVRLDAALDGVIAPYFGGTIPAAPIAASQEEEHLTWTLDLGAGIGMAQISTNRLAAPGPAPPAGPGILGGRVTPEGYFRVNPDAEALRRLIAGFEQRAATLMAASPALAVRATEPGDAGAYRAAFKARWEPKPPENPPEAPTTYELSNPGPIAWAAIAGLTAALDSIVIAVMKPGWIMANPDPEASSEGEVLAPLVQALRDEIDSHNWPSRVPSNAAMTAVLRGILSANSPLIGTSGLDALVQALRYVHGLPDVATPDATPEARLLQALLDHAKTGAPVSIDAALHDALRQPDSDDLLGAVMTAVFKAEETLQSEAGAEAAIVRLFDTAARHPNKGAATADRYLTELVATDLAARFDPPLVAPVPGAIDHPATLVAGVEEAWRVFRARLEGPFNGAEAVRRSAGLDYVTALLGGELQARASEMSQRIKSADLFARRFGLATKPDLPFEAMLAVLVKPTPPAAHVGSIMMHLSRVYLDTTETLDELFGGTERFVPDTAPQPLAVQIAGDVTGHLFDDFLKDFNGIGVAIARVDEKKRPWAHAHLAALSWRKAGQKNPPQSPQYGATIHPMLPVASDGRGPLFVEYHGFPFADSGLAEVMANDGSTGTTGNPFYEHEVADPGHGQPAVPRLAYGCWFQSFAFVTTNAGTLPLALQAGPNAPWLPGPPSRPALDDVVANTSYQRRTAIGEMMLVEVEDVREHSVAIGRERFGKVIDGVAPLSHTYPRVSLVSSGGKAAFRDLFRESDGVGTLTLGRGAVGATTAVGLEAIAQSDTASALTIRLFDRQALSPDDLGLPLFTQPDRTIDTAATVIIEGTARRIGLSFTLVAAPPVDLPPANRGGAPASPPPPANAAPATRDLEVSIAVDGTVVQTAYLRDVKETNLFWLRLGFAPKGPKVASLSFAAPDGSKYGQPTSPLLLLAPPEADPKKPVWIGTVTKPVTVRVTTPRVGFLDFERWIANPTLGAEALGSDAAPFERGLLMAYAMRHLDADLAKALDRLPDPAVIAVKIDLCATDCLVAGAHFKPWTETISFAPDLKREVSKFAGKPMPDPPTPTWLLKNLFQPLDQAFRFLVAFDGAANAPLLAQKEEKTVRVSVPAGTVAHLTVEVLVPAMHLPEAPVSENDRPGVFHRGLLQHASRMDVGFVAFPSVSLRLETMIDAVAATDAAIVLADRMIAVEPASVARRYDIVAPGPDASADDLAAWRLYSHADTTSQRWRPSGRPVYRGLRPKELADGRRDTAAVRISSTQDIGRLYDFENEAFFDRPNIDTGEPVSQVLAPLPAKTILQTLVWEEPSATYWRHRFTLRSRYAGALRQPVRREVAAYLPLYKSGTTTRPIPETWTMRVAMLADLGRLSLTRPQLRALIPLTTAPSEGTPPILSILQEPPFARGGLADRIGAELKTGFGYGFEAKDAPVEILDSRKEIGPDPRLTYRPMSADVALRLGLSAEGPIGLTFDPPGAAAPAFPNAMILLSPALLGPDLPDSLEEHFLGISMRRYLDPHWVIDGPAPEASLDAERCWWIEGDIAGAHALLTYLSGAGRPVQVLSVTTDERHCSVWTLKRLVDGVRGVTGQKVEVARIDGPPARLAILHQPVAPGRYSLSVFAYPPGGAVIPQGRSEAPLMMASFDWSPREPGEAAQRLLLSPAKDAGAVLTMASAPTFLAWARTNRDVDRATLASPTRDGHTVVRAEIATLVATVAKEEGKSLSRLVVSSRSAKTHLVSSTEANPFPVHVHRHLGVLVTRLLKDPGRPVEDYVGADLFVGRPNAVGQAANIDLSMVAPDERLNARLIEIETPAAVLCGSDVPVPDTYRRHYMDLVATGGTDGDCRAWLHLRFVGKADHLAKFARVTVKLRPVGAEPTEIVLDFAGKTVVGADLNLWPSAAAGSDLGWLRHLDGSTSPVAVPVINLKGRVGIFLEIVAETGAGQTFPEFWADVSLLHSAKPTVGRLDLDWLFSPTAGDDIAAALRSEALSDMVEAQARIVSVSLPIPIIGAGI